MVEESAAQARSKFELSGVGLVFPAQQALFGDVHPGIQDKTQQHQREDADPDRVQVIQGRGDEDHMPQPIFGRDEFTDDRPHQRKADVDAERADDGGQRRRHDDLAEDLAAGSAERHHHFLDVGVGVLGGLECGQQRDDGRERHRQGHFRDDAGAEPQDDQRREGDLGHAGEYQRARPGTVPRKVPATKPTADAHKV
ncbi:hypothetical protein G6F65_018256 [Rhizopus arrhizus]|nr:hypothetical protein G6F65_018256 [Rhizopus arrhizus]